MKQELNKQAAFYKRRQLRQKRWKKLMTFLAAVVVFCTTYALILPAITMERKTVCGLEEHEHTEACYTEIPAVMKRVPVCTREKLELHEHTYNCYDTEGRLICGYADFAAHQHDASCYREDGTLWCFLPEIKVHAHTDGCFVIPQVEVPVHQHTGECYEWYYGDCICGQPESEGHLHSAEAGCFNEFGDLICQEEESDGHFHTEACYEILQGDLICGEFMEPGEPVYGEPQLICSRPEIILHKHNESCYDENGYRICGKTEILEHVHREACFEEVEVEPQREVLTCTLEEHRHTEECCASEEEKKDEEQIPEEEETSDEAEGNLSESETEDITAEDNISGDILSEVTTAEDILSEDITTEDIISEDGDSEATASSEKEPVSMEAEEEMAVLLEDQGAAEQGTGVDFGPYITKASVQKIVNNEWKEATEFIEGDQVRVTIDYQIPDGVLDAERNRIYYQLPVGVSPLKEESGLVYSNGKSVGTYIITTDGLITIDFYEDFVQDGVGFPGDIFFTGTVSAQGSESGAEWEFGGSGGSIIVKPPSEQEKQHDNKAEKTGVLSEDGKTIDYTVRITTQNGSDPIQITDTLTNGSYDADSLQIVKKDSDGGDSTLQAGDYTVSYEGNSMKITGLPSLADSTESYEITYRVNVDYEKAQPDGYLKVSNSVMANGWWTYDEKEISKSKVSKSGFYDSNTGLIKWTIKVNEGKEDISGWTLTDTLEGTDVSYVGDIRITAEDGTELTGGTLNKGDHSFTYTFPEGSNQVYTITYYTTVPENGDTSVSNGVSLNDGKTGNYTGGGTVGVSHRKQSMNKQAAGETALGSTSRKYTWNIYITLAEQKFNQTGTVTYEDTILTPSTPEGCRHYGTADEIAAKIDESICFKYTDRSAGTNAEVRGKENVNSYFTYVVTCYDAENNVVANTDGSTEVVRFTVEATPVSGLNDSIYGNSIEFRYPTAAEFPNLSGGETVTFVNEGKLGDVTVRAEQSYTKPKKLEKYLTDVGEYYWGQQSVAYTGEGHTFTYKIVLRTDLTENGDITLTDTLPKGVEFADLTLWKLGWDGNENSNWPVIFDNNDNITYDFVCPGKIEANPGTGADRPTAEVTTDAEGRQVVSIKIKGGYNNINKNDKLTNGRVIILEYQVRLTDAMWPSGSAEKVVLTNKVIGLGSESSKSITVTREPQVVKKFVEQLTDTSGNKLNVLRYKVVINPGAEDLDPNSDYISLEDQISSNGISAAYLQLSNVKLYSYDKTKEEGIGEELDSSLYKIVYNDSNIKNPGFTMTIPDQQALVLVYTYNIDIGSSVSPAVSNEVKLKGYTSKQENTKIETNDSGATAQKAYLDIYKVDGEDYSKLLNGAVFEISYYDSTANSWSQVTEVSTGSIKNGCLRFESVSAGSNTDNEADGIIQRDTIYRLEEIHAPDGYSIGEKSTYYFCWLDKKTKDTLTYPDGFDRNLVTAFSEMGGEMYIPNDSSSIQVKKIWQDSNGKPVAPGSDSVNVKLTRQTIKPITVPVTIHVFKHGNGNVYEEAVLTYSVPAGGSMTISSWFYNGNCYVWINDGEQSEWVFENGFATYTLTGITESLDFNIMGIDTWQCPDASKISVEISEPTEFEYSEVETIGTETLNSSNNWSYSWNVDKTDSEGNLYYYSVTEEQVPAGWSVAYGPANGQIQAGYIPVINTKPDENSTTTQLGIQKVWKDAAGAVSTPAVSSISFDLYQKASDTGEEKLYGTYTIDASTNWIKTLKNLPYKRFDSDGNEICTYTYRVQETTTGDFVVSYSNNDGVSLGNILIENTKGATALVVEKRWIDSEGNTVAAPVDSITYRLMQKPSQGEATEYYPGQTLTLSAANGWKAQHVNLPDVDQDDTSVTYSYYVEEITEGYEVGYSDNNTEGIVSGTLTITNKVPEAPKTEIQVKKVWTDANGEPLTNLPDMQIEYELFRKTENGTPESVGTFTLPDADKQGSDRWERVHTELPAEDEDGNGYSYYVIEKENICSTDYSTDNGTTYAGGQSAAIAGGTIIIRNAMPSTSIDVEKRWNNVSNPPEMINFDLYRLESTDAPATVSLTAEDTAAAYNTGEGITVNFTGRASASVLVANTSVGDKIQITVMVDFPVDPSWPDWKFAQVFSFENAEVDSNEHLWSVDTSQGSRGGYSTCEFLITPTSTNVNICLNAGWSGEYLTLNAVKYGDSGDTGGTGGTGGSGDTGETGGTGDSGGSGETGGTGGSGDSGESGGSGDSGDGEETQPEAGTYIGSYSVQSSNNWRTSVANLPLIGVNSDGQLVYYSYYVRETTGGYTVSYENNQGITSGTAVIINTGTTVIPETIDITVEKQWKNGDGSDLSDHSYAAVVQLYQISPAGNNSEPQTYGDPVTLSLSGNNWQYTWSGLPKRDANQQPYQYFVAEIMVTDASDRDVTDSFTASYSGGDSAEHALNETGTVVITNTMNTSYELPSTGGRGRTFYQLGGIIFVCMALLGLIGNKGRVWRREVQRNL